MKRTRRKYKHLKSAYNRYQQFHGRKPRKLTFTKFKKPKALVYLGRATRIEYESNKKNGGGDGRKTIYYHDHTSPVKLFMDSRGKKWLYLFGRKLKVTKAGIEN